MITDMMMKLYLDTSVVSAYFDYSKPLRQLITQKWFENEASRFELYGSVITIEEVDRLKNPVKKEGIKDLILNHEMKMLELSDKVIGLADTYVKKGAVPKTEPEDARHIAIAVVNRIECLASWNFKHMVSVNPIRKIHEISRKEKYPIIEIGTLEMYGGSKYGNL